MQRTSGMCACVCGGSEEGGKEEEGGRGPAKPIAVARGLWVGLQASAKHMRYMCIRTYTEGSLPGSLWGLAGPGQGCWVVSRMAHWGVPYSPVGMQGALGMCGWVWEGSEGERGGRGTPRSCGADSCRGWAVGWATSVSEVHVIYVNTYVHEGVAPGVVTQSSRGF